MRAKEFIVEAGVLAGMKQDYQSGYDAVAKVLNPKRWGDSDQSDKVTDTAVDKLDLRDAVNLAASGKTIMLKDQQILKQAYAQVKAGTLKTSQDSETLLAALDAAKSLQSLSPQQQQTLSAFAKDL